MQTMRDDTDVLLELPAVASEGQMPEPLCLAEIVQNTIDDLEHGIRLLRRITVLQRLARA